MYARLIRSMSLTAWFVTGWFLNACQAEYRAATELPPVRAQYIVYA